MVDLMPAKDLWGRRVDDVYQNSTAQLALMRKEYERARSMHAPMHSSHEGYAVILEELDEMWDAIKANDIPHARKECLQVAAMCLAFLLEVKE